MNVRNRTRLTFVTAANNIKKIAYQITSGAIFTHITGDEIKALTTRNT